MTDKHKTYKHNCEKCNFYTDYKSNYNRHLKCKTHLGEHRKPRCDKKDEYKCDKCYYATKNLPMFKLHKITNHSSTTEEKKEKLKYYCVLCEVGAMHNSIFQKHLKTLNHKKMVEFSNSLQTQET